MIDVVEAGRPLGGRVVALPARHLMRRDVMHQQVHHADLCQPVGRPVSELDQREHHDMRLDPR